MSEQQTPQVLLSTVLVRLNHVELAIQARDLERQLAEAKVQLEIETAREECQRCHRHWSPSLIESDVCIFCIHNEAKAKLAAMTKERDALLKDKERLDWLESEKRVFHPLYGYVPMGSGLRPTFEGFIEYGKQDAFLLLRQAIDDAMKGTQ